MVPVVTEGVHTLLVNMVIIRDIFLYFAAYQSVLAAGNGDISALTHIEDVRCRDDQCFLQQDRGAIIVTEQAPVWASEFSNYGSVSEVCQQGFLPDREDRSSAVQVKMIRNVCDLYLISFSHIRRVT